MKVPTAMMIALALAAAPLAASADDAHHKSSMTSGVVKKVDKEAAKVTIQHGRLEKLDMPAMTMVFRVKDPAMLDQVKAGDKIRFDADKVDGQFMVMKVEPAK